MLYTIAIYLYQLCVMLVSPFNCKARKMLKGQHETFRILKRQIDKEARYVWFHAASLGEFEQGRPLMERFRREYPQYKILLTFFSPSGYEVRKNYEGADVICYLPFDTPSNVYRFFHLVRPEMAFFIKYEFWLDYMWACHHYHIPFYSVSSIFRPNKIFFRWYGRHYAGVLRCFTHFFVQNEQSRQLLEKIGITEVSITGDTRFDRVLQIKEQSKHLPIVESFVKGATHVFVAGSSWSPDEDIFIPYYNNKEDWRIIIAPHVISEEHLQQIEQKYGDGVVRYTKTDEQKVSGARCLIIDCFGLLSSIYHYGNVAYVGGGFGVGIHNVLEAAVWDIPVIFGPNNKHFQEAQALMACGGGFEISDANAFGKLVDNFAEDKHYLKYCGDKAGHYVKSQAGATEMILNEVRL